MSKHTASTDQVTQITLTSAIEQVTWTRPLAAPGGTVGLEVFTRFVGNGAAMEIKLTDHDGKAHGTFNEILYANQYRSEIRVPAEAKTALYAEVKLSAHGLQQKSAPLLLGPPITVENCQWSAEEVRRGDILTLTADVKGAVEGVEARVAIYEHDADGAHDLVTIIPAQVRSEGIELEWAFEYVEDTDDIPTEAEAALGYAAPEYFFRVTVMGVWAESPLLYFKDAIAVVVIDEATMIPYADQKYVLHLPDGTTQEGTLDAQGSFVLEDLPPGPCKLELPDLELDEENGTPVGAARKQETVADRQKMHTTSRKIKKANLASPTGVDAHIYIGREGFEYSI